MTLFFTGQSRSEPPKSRLVPKSERITQAELEGPLKVLVVDFAERSAIRVIVRAIPVRMIRNVEHLAPERDSLFFADCELLEQRAGPVQETGVIQQITIPLRSERARGRLLERLRIEIQIRIRVRGGELGVREVRVAA